MTVAEFAAHTAYLEPWTGIGVLVAPRPEADVTVADDWFLELSWSGPVERHGRTGGLSLQTADRVRTLEQLNEVGWNVLSDEATIAPAGRTSDGCPVLFLYAEPGAGRQLVLEDFQHAITALHLTADLRHER